MTTSVPPSQIEAPLITSPEVAERANELLYSQDDRVNLLVRGRVQHWTKLLGLDVPDLSEGKRGQRRMLLQTGDAGRIFMANMAARYGSNWEKFDWQAYARLHDLLVERRVAGFVRGGPGLKKLYLPYHQAEHPIWMWERLIEVYREYRFEFSRCCVVSMSVGPHDLEQLTPGMRADGIGWNEWKSAIEARDIMIGAGFDAERDEPLFERVMLNIYGTTFSFDPRLGYLGALAPILVARVQAKYPDWETNSSAQDEIQDLLLTADVDTATVADFPEYARTAAYLCEEVLVARAHRQSADAVATFRFLTAAQKRFWELQRFNSRYAKELFEPRKRRNLPQFEELIAWMEARFEATEAGLVDRDGRRVEDGSVVTRVFLEKALELCGERAHG